MSALYDILNINKDAEPETIKKAYKKMAMKYHPDRNPKNKEESEKKFKEIAKAYEIWVMKRNVNYMMNMENRD